MAKHQIDLEKQLERGKRVGQEIVDAFKGLSNEQLNWKPDNKSWSVGECLDHLITSNKTYFPVLEDITSGNYRPDFWAKNSPFSSMFGKMLLDSVSPEVKRKAISPKAFKPSYSNITIQIVNDFEKHQEQLITYFEKTKGMNHGSIMIHSPAGAFITYSLSYLVEMLFNHEQRHFNQAKRVMNSADFPK